MEPIHVPKPPKEAFNKHRRMSDLIRKQVAHFKHLEYKLPEDMRRQLPQHPIVTEDDAARYIAPMTRLLLSQNTEAAPMPAVVPRKSRVREPKGLFIAAATDSANQKGPMKKTAKKRTPLPSKRSKR